MRFGIAWARAALSLLCASCAPAEQVDVDAQRESSVTSTTFQDGVEHEGTYESDESTSSSAEPEDRGSNFLDVIDGGTPSFECSSWLQDCASGEKCAHVSVDGTGAWNGTACVPVVDDPDQRGDSCWVVGSPLSGFDSCDKGLWCWDVDPETSTGMCVALCQGSEANPSCEDPNEACALNKSFAICLATCDPLEQACPVGCACYPTNGSSGTFQCIPDASGDGGHFGDPCESLNTCKPGNFCAAAATVPGCTGSSGCCTSYCNTTQPTCPGASGGQECIPFFEPGQAPPDFEELGACAIP